MNNLESVYTEAVAHTKNKLYDDVDSYLEEKEHPPTFQQYIADRGHYIEQIWINVWLNKATNSVSREMKKQFLEERGFETEGVARKFINHLFRTEIRDYQPFPVKEWLEQRFESGEWEKRYADARVKARQRKAEEEEATARRSLYLKIDEVASQFLAHQRETLYLYVRYFIAKQLVQDMETKTRFQKVDVQALEEKLISLGSFQINDYSILSTFLEELTGEIHKNDHWGQSFFEYEMYYFYYEKLSREYVSKLICEKMLERIPSEFKQRYEEVMVEPLTVEVLQNVLFEKIYELSESYFHQLQEEYVSDLVHLADEHFNEVVHKKIYEHDLAERVRKIAEEIEEKKRKKERHAQMMEDIFSREYSSFIKEGVRYVLHVGETNTGKTHHALERLKVAQSGLYLAPLRLLALEVFDRLNAEGIPCSLKTGEEEKVVSGAQHYSCTVEMFHEKERYDVIVIDEAQMIADKDRGFSWYKAITKANANEVHVIGSMNVKSLLMGLLGEEEVEIHEYRRDTPLLVESKEFTLSNVKRGDALICFSRRRVLETSSRLQSNGYSVSMIYGSMPPETRKKQIEKFNSGEAKVIVATDAIGMGLNLPIRRIVFLENEKFDGIRRRRLHSQEVKQISGRAGRKGIYDVGYVAFYSDIKGMKRLLEQPDEPVYVFAIAPTNSVFERFQKYSRDLDTFFELWQEFKNPKGTKKASLAEERELFEVVRGTEIEARLSLIDLYSYLHIPFQSNDQRLVQQWFDTLTAIVNKTELPEPKLENRTLEDLEYSYKAIGLHLLFLYRLQQRTEAIYWERVRAELSDKVHERLKTDIETFTKKCRNCRKPLPWDYDFNICKSCYIGRY